MAQLIVRQIEEDVKERLRRRARDHGVSMEEEVRAILQAAVLRDVGAQPGLGTRIADLFRHFEDSSAPLEPYPWDQEMRPARFDE